MVVKIRSHIRVQYNGQPSAIFRPFSHNDRIKCCLFGSFVQARNVHANNLQIKQNSDKAIPPSYKRDSLSSQMRLRGQGKQSMDNVMRSHGNVQVINAITIVLTSCITINHGGEL